MKKNCSFIHPFRRMLSLVLAFVMLLGMVPVTRASAAEGTALYLEPNENWLQADARFAMYYWNDSGSGWAGMSDEDGDFIYEGTVPAGYSNVIFCRMNPAAEENSWENKWNQTSDLTVPTDGTNLYTVADGTWDMGGGAWSVFETEEEPAESSSAASEEEVLYIVAGDSGLCGSNWDAADTANRMTLTGDGTYEKVYTDVAPGTYSLKVTDGTWDNNWGDNGNNYTFLVSAVCDVTVSFDPSAGTVSVSGDAVGQETGLEITSMHAVGNGSGNWLNGSNWDVTANAMTETEENVYEITFEDVPAGTYQYKFAANGAWTHSWGIGDTEGEAVYNGQNIHLTVEYELADVTLKLDMTAYDHATKTGALYSAAVAEAVAEPAVDYYLVGYINGADYGCEGDWENLGEYKFVDGTLTATFTADSYVFVKTGDNASWYLFETYTEAATGTLAVGNGEKMKVPGNTELVFTLVENADGTLTLSYTEAVSEPAVDYYLVGYINGADYGCESDWENLGEYKFVDGTLTATFTADSYVFIKTGDNASWYLFETYTEAATGTLAVGNGEKMKVPGNTELVFTLVENADGTLTLTYAEKADTTDVTLHFYKTEGWGSTVYAYLWSNGAVPGYSAYNAWPGVAIAANTEHAGWYDLVVSLETPMAFNFIFNDGGNQTADLSTGEVTGDTELWIVGNEVMSAAPGEWSGDYDYTAYLHFCKPEGWADTVNAYVWDASGVISSSWPGDAIGADSVNSGWYDVAVIMDDDTGFSFIFNDGSSQTADLATGTLDITTHLWIVDGAVLTEAPSGWKDTTRTYHVPGTFPGPSWDAASNQMVWNAELGLYVYTFENVPAANYEYKISVNGSWAENYGAGGVRDGANIAVAVTEATDVTVYFNDETHNSATSVSYRFAEVTLSGTGIPEGTVLTDRGLSGIYSVTVPMTAGIYTDLVITCDGVAYAFGEVTVEEDKDVTFYMDPITEIFYCDASEIPVNTAAIFFDSQQEEYKKPFGAVATGETVTFAIDTGADVTSAVLVVKGVDSYPMTAAETETGKRWTATASFAAIGEYDYYFSLSNGSTVAIYSDDDGYYGEGMVTDLTGVKPYDLVVYKAGFETPDWMKDAVIYQIFPDRFFDGDVSNNQAQTWARGDVNYEYITDWYTLPENPEQKALLDEQTYRSTGAHYGDGEWSNEIYGGDLEGITQRIGYLKALGVNVIYLNPVFWSISNHRYDAVDYTEIDPILGTMGDFRELVEIAEGYGMHIILDGVFNHVSDDSVYFDRYYKFLGTSNKVGAYPYWAYVYDYMSENTVDKATAEAAAKAYFTDNYGITDWSYTEWFAVSSTTMAGTVDSIGLRAGKEVYAYEGWWGYDSMPIIYSTNGSEYQTGNWAEEIIYNASETSVTQFWISEGNNGWRLDVANEVSDETWQRFRDSVKALDSDAVIIGEIWDDATKYLKGDMYDSVMNYLFRNAVTDFAMGADAEQTMKELEKIRERYPEEAFYAMMNLVGSHDTSRILSYLDGIGDDRSDKSLEAAFPTWETTSDEAKQMQRLVAFLQFTYAGAPTIYYGDEIGMVGSDDPDDRRAMEWGKGSKDLVEWYAKLAAIREAYPALRTGTVEPMELENSYDLLGYVRRDERNTVTVIANNAFEDVTVQLEGTYVDLITGKTFAGTVPACSGVILVSEKEVKPVAVNYAALAPAYDGSYIVAERPEGVHVHKYEAAVTAPTCTEGGYTTYTCDCGEVYVAKETLPLGHDEQAQLTAATCTADGSAVYTCTVCGNVRTEVLPATGHSYTHEDADGIRTYTCTVCGESHSSDIRQIASGKSLTLKFIHPETGKTVSASKVKWEIAECLVTSPEGEAVPFEDVSAYATLKNGVLKTKKCGDKVTLTVTATLKSDESISQMYTVEILPAATKLSIWGLGQPIAGMTMRWNVNPDSVIMEEEYLELAAYSYPGNAKQEVIWKSSDTKVMTVDENGVIRSVWNEKTGKFRTGTVTITATAADGSGKKASFKVVVSSLAGWVEISRKDGQAMEDIPTDWYYQSDDQLQESVKVVTETCKGTYADAGTELNLTAKLDPNATQQGITWYCYSNYATISKGVLSISSKAPAGTWIWVYAYSKDGYAQDRILVEVKNEKRTVDIWACSGYSYTNNKNEVYVDVSTMTSADAVGSVYLMGTEMDSRGYGVGDITDWTLSGTKIAQMETVPCWWDNDNLCYRFDMENKPEYLSTDYQIKVTPKWDSAKNMPKTGTVTLTGTASDGVTKASRKIVFASLVSQLSISTREGKNMGIAEAGRFTNPYAYDYETDTYGVAYEGSVVYATAGQTVSLTAVTNSNASGNKLNWYAGCYDYPDSVKISSGKLTLSKDIATETVVWVEVWATYGGVYTEETWIPVVVTPRAVNVHLRTERDGQMKYVSNTTGVWDVNDGMSLNLSALVYPFAASQDVKWTVSQKTIATVANGEDGTAVLNFTGTRFGKLTVTAAAKDGSGVKTSFTLNVVKSVEEIALKDNAVTSVAAGKTLKLASQIVLNPTNATNKKLSWSIVSENPIGAKLDKTTGVLTTYKNRSDKVEYLDILVKALDGYGAEQTVTVAVYPRQTTKVIASAAPAGKAITSKQTLTLGTKVTFWVSGMPEEGIADVYTCKSANTKVATVESNGDGSFTVTPLAKGSAKLTFTAADGTGKTTAVTVTVVPAE